MKGIIALVVGFLLTLSGVNLYNYKPAKNDINNFIENKFPELTAWKSELNIEYRELTDDDRKNIAERLKEAKEISKSDVDLMLHHNGFLEIGYKDSNVFYLNSGDDFEYFEVYNFKIEDLENIEPCGEDCDFYSDEDYLLDKGLYQIIGHQKCDRFQAPYSCEVLLEQKGLIKPFNPLTYNKRMIIGELNTGNGIYIFSGKFSPKIADLVSQRRRSAANT